MGRMPKEADVRRRGTAARDETRAARMRATGTIGLVFAPFASHRDRPLRGRRRTSHESIRVHPRNPRI